MACASPSLKADDECAERSRWMMRCGYRVVTTAARCHSPPRAMGGLSSAWVPTGPDPARDRVRLSPFISRLSPFSRKVKKKQRLWRKATTAWSASCAAKKHKTNVIAAQSARMGQSVAPHRGGFARSGLRFRGLRGVFSR